MSWHDARKCVCVCERKKSFYQLGSTAAHVILSHCCSLGEDTAHFDLSFVCLRRATHTACKTLFVKD